MRRTVSVGVGELSKGRLAGPKSLGDGPSCHDAVTTRHVVAFVCATSVCSSTYNKSYLSKCL
jgi:hypothetical protein